MMRALEQEKQRAMETAVRLPRRRPLVSVVIVNFNAGPVLTAAVHSVLASSVSVELLVADNGSTDGSLELLRRSVLGDARLRIIENRRNLGFGRACNLLMAQTQGDYFLVLNPDALIQPDTLERMVKVLQACPDAAMAGCLIRNPDGSEQAGCRRAVPTPWRSLVRVLHLNRVFPHHPRFHDFVLTREPLSSNPVAVEAISGAFMLVRREIVERIGAFDEAYFMHCEDLDWCMRVRLAGWRVLFVSGVEIVHYKGTCSQGRPVRVLWHTHKGMLRFYRKFFRDRYPAPLMVLVAVAVWTRFGIYAAHALLQHARTRVTPSKVGQALAMKLATAPRPPVLLRAHSFDRSADGAWPSMVNHRILSPESACADDPAPPAAS